MTIFVNQRKFVGSKKIYTAAACVCAPKEEKEKYFTQITYEFLNLNDKHCFPYSVKANRLKRNEKEKNVQKCGKILTLYPTIR